MSRHLHHCKFFLPLGIEPVGGYLREEYGKCTADHSKGHHSVCHNQYKDTCKVICADLQQIRGNNCLIGLYHKIHRGVARPGCEPDHKGRTHEHYRNRTDDHFPEHGPCVIPQSGKDRGNHTGHQFEQQTHNKHGSCLSTEIRNHGNKFPAQYH